MTKTFAAVSTFVLAFGMAGQVWGQGLTGSIVGRVTDPSQASVAQARIIVKNVNTNAEIQTSTDADGV